ncbi:ARF1 [Symbiodinium natans]|uniref:ARF1 protein n=1 Tax=Symbiodinium natans TaxID=878477 RepID=A0A812UAS5_9DINO|nr:ARF1 [Symbiodinium natans]
MVLGRSLQPRKVDATHPRSLPALSARRSRRRFGRPRRRRLVWDAAEALGLSGLLRQIGRRVRPWRKRSAKWKRRATSSMVSFWQEWGASRWIREAFGLLLRIPLLRQVLFRDSQCDASLLFLFVAKGRPNRDRLNMPHRNRRDTVARCLSGALWRAPGVAYQDRAAALLFEDGRTWLLDTDATVSSVGRLPNESALLSYVWRSGKTGSGGVREVVPPRSDRYLEAAAYRLFRSLGSPAGSALILLDDTHPSLPLVGFESPPRIRRALCLLGCPAGLSPFQERAFARAARCAGWQVLRLRLGKASEFASKMVARLQVWHSCGRLFPSLDAVEALGGMRGSLPWPSQRNLSKDYDSGALSKVGVHFLVPVDSELAELTCHESQRSFAARGELALAARSTVAAVCHSKGGWRGCQITLCFGCGGMITITGALPDRLVKKSVAMTESNFLTELTKAAKLSNQENAESARGVEVHRAGESFCCEHALVLDIMQEGSNDMLTPRQEAEDSGLTAESAHPADKLLAALDQRPESLLVDLGTTKTAAASRRITASLCGCDLGNAPEVIGILQSGLLGEEQSSLEVLRTILQPPHCVSPGLQL